MSLRLGLEKTESVSLFCPSTSRYYLLAADRAWHGKCLRCCRCSQALDTELSCFCRGGNIYCKDCRWIYSHRQGEPAVCGALLYQLYSGCLSVVIVRCGESSINHSWWALTENPPASSYTSHYKLWPSSAFNVLLLLLLVRCGATFLLLRAPH